MIREFANMENIPFIVYIMTLTFLCGGSRAVYKTIFRLLIRDFIRLYIIHTYMCWRGRPARHDWWAMFEKKNSSVESRQELCSTAAAAALLRTFNARGLAYSNDASAFLAHSLSPRFLSAPIISSTLPIPNTLSI